MTLSEAIDWGMAEFLLLQCRRYVMPADLRNSLDVVLEYVQSPMCETAMEWRVRVEGKTEGYFPAIADALAFGTSRSNREQWQERKLRNGSARKG